MQSRMGRMVSSERNDRAVGERAREYSCEISGGDTETKLQSGNNNNNKSVQRIDASLAWREEIGCFRG